MGLIVDVCMLGCFAKTASAGEFNMSDNEDFFEKQAEESSDEDGDSSSDDSEEEEEEEGNGKNSYREEFLINAHYTNFLLTSFLQPLYLI